MFLRFTHWVKQLLFSGLNWIQAHSYLSGGWVDGWLAGWLGWLEIKANSAPNWGLSLGLSLAIWPLQSLTKGLIIEDHKDEQGKWQFWLTTTFRETPAQFCFSGQELSVRPSGRSCLKYHNQLQKVLKQTDSWTNQLTKLSTEASGLEVKKFRVFGLGLIKQV